MNELMGVIWLKAELKVRTLNQRKLAKMCGFSASEQDKLSSIFQGKRAMSPGMANRIAVALYIDPSIVLRKFKLI